MEIFKLTPSQKNWNKGIIITTLIGIFFIVVNTPISETFSCDKNLTCTLERNYIVPIFNSKKTFEINAVTDIETFEHFHGIPCRRRSGHSLSYHLGLKGLNNIGKVLQIFKSPEHLPSRPDYNIVRNLFNKEKLLFQQYKFNPETGFYLKSNADKIDFKFRMYIWLIFMSALVLWNILDKKKKTL